jgi:hypothetical protein
VCLTSIAQTNSNECRRVNRNSVAKFPVVMSMAPVTEGAFFMFKRLNPVRPVVFVEGQATCAKLFFAYKWQ